MELPPQLDTLLYLLSFSNPVPSSPAHRLVEKRKRENINVYIYYLVFCYLTTASKSSIIIIPEIRYLLTFSSRLKVMHMLVWALASISD